MKYVIFFGFVLVVAVSAIPLDPDNVVADDDGNLYYNYLVPLSRARRQAPGSSYIKAGGAYSTQYGAGGQILANKNLAYGKHYSIDAQAKYNQFGRHKQGWGGLNYSLRW